MPNCVKSISAVIVLLCCISIPYLVWCQDIKANKDVVSVDQLSQKLIRSIGKRYSNLENKLLRSAEKTLKRLQKQEAKLGKKLVAKDSVSAQKVFSSKQQYLSLLERLKNPNQAIEKSLKGYVPNVDSIGTIFRFLGKDEIKIAGIDADKLKAIQSASASLKGLQSQLQASTDIQAFIRQRKQMLQAQLEQLGLTKQLKAFKKEAYYYQAQFNEYKSMLHDPDKLVNKALGIARGLPGFQDFMKKNSFLAQLFPQPAGLGTAQALAGLQTRSAVQQQLTQRVGAGVGGSSPQQYMQQQLSQAQNQLNALKDKINQAGGGSSDLDIPDFKPNSQRTKTFWKRIEYGLNIQSQKTNSLLPVTSDLALTAGYRLNDKAVLGVGAGYKIGWGKNINNIRISSEGVSLRSYADIKLKGSIWISSGYEYNYQQAFSGIEALKHLDAWQRSGLVGLTKKYKVGKKNGKLQLLWDFLSYSQLPRTQPLKFRVGYTF